MLYNNEAELTKPATPDAKYFSASLSCEACSLKTFSEPEASTLNQANSCKYEKCFFIYPVLMFFEVYCCKINRNQKFSFLESVLWFLKKPF
jgi:hypothetical protein